MKTLMRMAILLSLGACSTDIDITAADIFGGSVEILHTTIDGTVYLGSEPMLGHQFSLQLFVDAPDLIPYIGDPRAETDPSTGRYSFNLPSLVFCSALPRGLWVQVAYRQVPTDPFTESDVMPWVIRDYSDCVDATLHAEDIVIPLPENQPTG